MGRDNSARERRPRLGDDLIRKVERGARKRLREVTLERQAPDPWQLGILELR
ncbi:hypothetical protein [Streptomyces mirabilis]|uniref:hypothetical protein n=1 Tax=Streptomyces mirabilis TaxID=68239 RepID=UPI003D9E5688